MLYELSKARAIPETHSAHLARIYLHFKEMKRVTTSGKPLDGR